jgi:AcrR family transcriptional regulator
MEEGPKAAADDARRPTRGRRSRETTRRKLVDAALRIVAKKGLDATTINEITEEADVGFGSFYNHFTSKNEIATIAFEQRANELGEINDLIGERESDPALAVAYIQRLFLTKAVNDPVWGWFVLHAANGLPEMSRVFMTRGKRDIERGISQDRFSTSCAETAMRIILASLLATMRAILEKDVPHSAVSETIECLLTMLGVPKTEALVLSRKKLPAYISSKFLD